jgi:hypothetical protein
LASRQCCASVVGVTPASLVARGNSWLPGIAGSGRKCRGSLVRGCNPVAMASSSSSTGPHHKVMDEARLQVAMAAAREEVLARDLARGLVVAAGISAKRTRGSVQTLFDAALESSEAARVQSVIAANDTAARSSHECGAKVTRKYVLGRELMSKKAMHKADVESEIRRILERAHERVGTSEMSDDAMSVDAAAAIPSVSRVPPQLFGTGQSVLQWWASWFAKCPEGNTPKQINKKLRPGWFSAEVLAYKGYEDVVYGGVRTTGHCYVIA